jgi:hypothetical protein
MKDFAQLTLLFAFLLVGHAGSVFAQQDAHFRRVTTTASSSGARSPSARTLRSTPARDVQAPRAASRVASASTTRLASLERMRAQSDVLHPYSSRSESLAQSDDRGSDGGRFSTWRNEPQPAAPAPRVTAAPRSHNYYPTLRSGVYAAQPVQLTANQGFLYPGSCCSASRSQVMAGMGAHHR